MCISLWCMSTLPDNAKLFSTVFIPVYTHTSNVQEFLDLSSSPKLDIVKFLYFNFP